MKAGLQVGSLGVLDWIVDPSMTITLGGNPRATVFSTPNMIMLMERAAREALRPYLDPEEESVGVEVNVQHLAGAPLGAAVRGIAKVTATDGKRVRFALEAWSQERLLGRGSHARAIVRIEHLVANLNKLSNPTPSAMNTSPDPSVALSLEQGLGSTADVLPAFTTLLVSIDQQVALVTLNRPQVHNAVNRHMTGELEQLVRWLANHPQQVRVVLLTGAGAAFCAGDDVKELPQLDADAARDLSYRQAELYLAFERLPQPIVALVNGDALGAGCVAAYSADFRLCTPAARFGMPEIRLGWPPGYGLAQLTALVGKARALELCLLGEPLAAARALEWGLVNEIIPAATLLARGQQLADKLLRMPAEALRQTKRLIHVDEGAQPKVAYRADTEAYVRCLQLADAQEGIAAFMQKRPPRFGA